MNARFALVIVTMILLGLATDALAEPWSQPLVNTAAWSVFAALLLRSRSGERLGYLLCLVLATAGELFLALAWGVYDYRLENLPLFVPPGHVLLYALGRWFADRVPVNAVGVLCAAVLASALVLAWQGIDQLSAPLAILFVLCVRYGPAPRLYAVMFVLALGLELVGTYLGNWTWRSHVPWFGWTTLNPPFAAGAFYCALDMLVGRVQAARTAATASTAWLR